MGTEFDSPETMNASSSGDEWIAGTKGNLYNLGHGTHINQIMTMITWKVGT